MAEVGDAIDFRAFVDLLADRDVRASTKPSAGAVIRRLGGTRRVRLISSSCKGDMPSASRRSVVCWTLPRASATAAGAPPPFFISLSKTSRVTRYD